MLAAHLQPTLTITEPNPHDVRDELAPVRERRSQEEPPPDGRKQEAEQTRPESPAPVEGRRRKRAAKPPALPPWPGRLPKPAPALVPARPLAAVVLDQDGNPVGVSARLEITSAPAALIIERAQPVAIAGWAGPWPVEERWWAPAESRRRARFQVALDDGRAFLLSLAGGHWSVEAIYD